VSRMQAAERGGREPSGDRGFAARAVSRLRSEVANRPLAAWLAAPFHPRHYVALWNMARLCPEFPHFLVRYLLGRGEYPSQVHVRTPTGRAAITVFHPVDVLTVNEIFFRGDYRARADLDVAVDLGANIGVAALYFLSRNERARCYCVEPDPRNVDKLRRNLAPFAGRYEVTECAVADRSGEIEFAIEPTGRYGGIGAATGQTIRVEARDVNAILAEVLRREKRIDVLKVDIEGLEATTVAAIRPDLLDAIGTIYFESARPAGPIHSGRFQQSRRGQVERLVRASR
jgi:FkbM family methyltransferase